MEFLNVLNQRQSIRDFDVNKKVKLSDLKKIIAEASRAPSWVNSQPWQVYLAVGKTLETIKHETVQKMKDGTSLGSEIPVMHRNQASLQSKKNMAKWTNEFNSFLGKDVVQVHKNQPYLYNAPAVAYLVLPKQPSAWSLYDLGAFGQSLMLAAQNMGIDSMPAWELVRNPDILRKNLGIKNDQIIVVGIALGYRKRSHINDFYTDRDNLDNFLTIKD